MIILNVSRFLKFFLLFLFCFRFFSMNMSEVLQYSEATEKFGFRLKESENQKAAPWKYTSHAFYSPNTNCLFTIIFQKTNDYHKDYLNHYLGIAISLGTSSKRENGVRAVPKIVIVTVILAMFEVQMVPKTCQ